MAARALHVELARRQAFARGAVHGNALQMLREGRLEIGPHAVFEPGVWLTVRHRPDPDRRRQRC